MLRKLITSFLFAMLGTQALAAPITRDFDEFASPPVTCCFNTTGVGGAIIYPDLTVSSGANGKVMNSTGWSNMQTSGSNLYGTLDSFINFSFAGPVSGLNFDLINGTSAFNFKVEYFDSAMNLLASNMLFLNPFAQAGSVGHLIAGVNAISFVKITGNTDFAVDTINFETGDGSTSVPEPGSIALLGLGALAMLRGRRARTTTRR